MKKTIMYLVLIVLISPFFAQAQDRTITFEHADWQAVLNKAKQENKLIFIDAYTTWCGPCKWMSANVFTNNDVADFYNQNFINAKFDMESQAGAPVSQAYNVAVYPTLLFVDGDGKLVHKAVGALPPDEFLVVGQIALDPQKRLSHFTDEYADGNRDAQFMYNYLEVLDKAYIPANDIIDQYWNGLTDVERVEEKNWEIVRDFVTDLNSAPFMFLDKNKDKYTKKYGKQLVADKFYDAYLNEFNELFRIGLFEGNEYESLKQQAEKADFGRSDELITYVELIRFDNTGDWENFALMAVKIVDDYKHTDPMELNYFGWQFYQYIDDAALLKKAEGWVRQAITEEETASIYDTLASLLFKQGKVDEAITTEEKALDLATQNGEDTQDYQNQLDMMKAAKK